MLLPEEATNIPGCGPHQSLVPDLFRFGSAVDQLSLSYRSLINLSAWAGFP